MRKRVICVLLVAFILLGGCSKTTSSGINNANLNLVLAVITLPIKIVGAAVAAAVGAAVGMGIMGTDLVN
ncbi:MAG: hypothetical protein JSS07_04220 [Proteobacteria bacterium]|nr:hypothetical protein [Pseudomonadota bacterium]